MSTRTTLRPFDAILNGDMSGTITSLATILNSLTMASYTVAWSGTTPVGTLAVQASNDYAANGAIVVNAGTWNTIPVLLATGSTVTAIPISGNTGNGEIDLFELPMYAVRLVYTPASGIGTLNAVIVGKVH
jgi:hypothetical protein